ncbi:MAG: DNA replication/repair protein RecF [Firmicutes bacterium]|nr:DNA replication/repair protein RecF [Bacillota bacterium]
MIIKSAEYTDFRNIESARLDFSPTSTILFGKNAQGKTNMLEGIYLFAQGKSMRAVHDEEMVRFGSDYALVRIVYESGGSENTLIMQIGNFGGGKRKQISKNGVRLERLSELIGSFRAVLFCPEHLFIVKGSPSERRSFVDVAISQLKPLYMRTLQRYNKVLFGRNAELKRAREGGDRRLLLESWSEQLAELAAKITVERCEYIDSLALASGEIYSDMTGGAETLGLSYRGCSRLGGEYRDEARIRKIYLSLLTENTEREIFLGSTQYGTHKDDIEITLDGREAKSFASQGQERGIVLSMKLAEGECSRRRTGEYPVFLFDDVLSELDPQRRSFVASGLGERQVIITACDLSASRRIPNGRKYYIKDGSAKESCAR